MAAHYQQLPTLPAIRNRLIGNVVLMAFTIFVVALRFLARLLTGSKLGWDDYLILAAVPQAIGMLICQGLWSVVGVGYPVADVPPENLDYINVVFLPSEILFACLIVTAKLSVLSFYLRVFTHGGMRKATKVMIILVGIWGIGNLLQFLLVCRVHDGIVDFTRNVQCDSLHASFISAGVFNSLTNLIIGLLPIYTIWSLKTVSVSTRLGLTVVFVLGISVTLVSLYRLLLLLDADGFLEPLQAMGATTALTLLEANLSILCNSLPMLLPLYSYWRYRRVYGRDEDEYISRMRDGSDDEPPKHRAFAFEDVTNGLPLETIYGQNHVHFTTAVASGDGPAKDQIKGHTKSVTRSKKSGGRWKGDEFFEDNSDGESTRRLGGCAGPTGITIETKWTITEETMSHKI